MHRLTALIVVAVVAAGCAQPAPVPADVPAPELGVPATTGGTEPSPATQPAPAATPAAAPSPSATAPSEDVEPSPAPVAPSAPPSPPPSDDAAATPAPSDDAAPAPATEPQVLLAVSDPTGDHGLEGPGWVDLTAVELVELGNDLRVTLRFAAALPDVPPEGQVPLIGVDIGSGADAHQLFVEGGGQQWSAYLQTPDGFVAYPGTFAVAGRAMVLQVPFNAVGSPTRAPVEVLVEWSEERPVLNAAAEDRLDGQPHSFDRTA